MSSVLSVSRYVRKKQFFLIIEIIHSYRCEVRKDEKGFTTYDELRLLIRLHYLMMYIIKRNRQLTFYLTHNIM